MAGDWIKMECSTPDKPEVLAITVKMGWDDPDLTVGKLFKLWRWFDQHTQEGNAASVTTALLDRIIGVSGFAEAVASVGWLVVGEGEITLPNFERHNGKTAKTRANTAKRVANHKGNAKSNAKGNAGTVTKNDEVALPREEKRREEKDIPPTEGANAPIPTVWDSWVSVAGDTGSSRAFLGKLIRDHGEDAVMPAVLQTVTKRPADPKQYIAGVLREKKSADHDFRGVI